MILIRVLDKLWNLLSYVSSCFKMILPNKSSIDSEDDNRTFSSIPSFGKYLLTCTYEVLNPVLWNSRKLGTTTIALEILNGMHFLTGGSGISRIQFFNVKCVLLSKASTVKALLRCKENVSKSPQYIFMKPWLRNCLLTSDKETWRVHRKLLAPTVYPKIIQSYLPVFKEQALVLANKLKDLQNQSINAADIMSFCTLDIIIETAMGVQLGLQKMEDSIYLDSVHTLSFCCIDRIGKVWYWPYWLFKLFPQGRKWSKALNYTRNFTMNIIEERKRELLKDKFANNNDIENKEILEGGKTRNLSFLDLALELHLEDKRFSIEDVQDEVEVFLLGGHETSAMTMSWALYLLGQNKSALNKVHKELDDVFGNDPDVPIELEQLKELKYLECVIKESARLYPPVPVIGRTLDQELIIDGKVIPVGTNCVIGVTQVHRDTDVYTNPEAFEPERFLSNGENNLDPYAFLAFSAGPRGCPGYRYAILQMKVVLSTILRRFTVSSDIPRDKMLLGFDMVLSPKGGIWVKVKSRS